MTQENRVTKTETHPHAIMVQNLSGCGPMLVASAQNRTSSGIEIDVTKDAVTSELRYLFQMFSSI